MKFASLDIVKRAANHGYAVPAFNINNSEWIYSALMAAEREKSPLILASSDRLVDFLGGFKLIKAMVESYCDSMEITIPVVLHLDHGQSIDRCMQAVDAGYSSVMIDGSKFPIDENIRLTEAVVDYAKSRGVTVEAEVGCVGGSEDGLNSGIMYADTAECVKLVEKTSIDALAAALGSVHGIYVGKPKLSFERMKEITALINVPLVLHGASGIPENQIKKCIELKHAKININTECNQVWINECKKALQLNPSTHEPRVVLAPARAALTEYMASKMREFGSSGRA